MHGRNIQPTHRFFDMKVKLKEGFDLKKDHGIQTPATPAAAVSAMRLTDKRRALGQESVCESGSPESSEAMMLAQRKPAIASDHVSVEFCWVSAR
jgi:hypothetical protein